MPCEPLHQRFETMTSVALGFSAGVQTVRSQWEEVWGRRVSGDAQTQSSPLLIVESVMVT